MTQSNPPPDQEIVLDVCWLEPPEPMERILDALSCMQSGQRLRVLIHREPIPLYRILKNNGYAYSTQSRDDHLFELLIWQRS